MPRRPNLRSISTQLLNTKLRVPPPGAGYIARPRLVARLNQSAQVPLTLISAPAGFGKTTLLAAWCAQTQLPVAWLSLGSGEDDPARWLQYVCAALETVDPHLSADAASLLQASASVPYQLVLTTLLNSFQGRAEPIALVLDDAHVLESPAVIALLAFLVENCPPALHLLVATRADPDLPLARYRVRRQLNEIRANDLRFTFDEAAEFLDAMTLHLTHGEINALETRTEGWIAGLQLAALSMRERTDHAQFIAAFSGSHRFILDYLLEQVLIKQPPEMQTFLLQTSILERMNAALCQAVTGRGDAQSRLEALEAHNLFVVPLDDTRQWYRYHSLFAEMLQHRLRQTTSLDAAALHRRASEWLAAEGEYADAVQHALAAHDFEMMAQILEQVGVQIALAGQPQTVANWLSALPEQMIQTRPMLATADAAVNLLSDHLEIAGTRLESAERILEVTGTGSQLTFVRTWRAIWRGEVALQVGDFAGFVAASQQGLTVAAPDDPSRLPLLVRVARAFQMTGDLTPPAEQALVATLKPVSDSKNLFTRLNSIVYLARLQTLQGRLHQARATYAQAEQAMPVAQGQPLSVIHPVYYSGLADLFREWNQLDLAQEHLKRGFALTATTLSIDADAMMLSYATLIRVQLARGEWNEAQGTVNELAEVAAARRFVPVLTAQIAAWRACVDMARGNLDAATRWATQLIFSAGDAPDFLRELEMVTWVRIWLAHAAHDSNPARLSESAKMLERWCNDAQHKQRQNSVIEMLVLSARVAEAQGKRAQALVFLERALRLGEHENYLRVFADEGAPLGQLLLALGNSKAPVNATYINSLLALLGAENEHMPQPTSQPHTGLFDPLSARELEVLRLIAQGASNQEIADALVIALPTVKRHISTIYDKLDVTSRTQAVVRAQALRLV